MISVQSFGHEAAPTFFWGGIAARAMAGHRQRLILMGDWCDSFATVK
jgi:hypothetical protein